MFFCLVLSILVLDQVANISAKCVLHFEMMASKHCWRPNELIYDSLI